MTGLPSPEPAGTDDHRLDGTSLDIVDEKRRTLLDLFPEARTEAGSIDFDQLRRALGDAVDPGKERFGLTWPGKTACFKAIQTPSMATLLPLPEKSVDFETTGNVIIEADNLEALKLLQKSYLGKIKMIYIDPPYNTGNDFIYPDDYSESLQTYLRYTNQIDTGGKRFTNNTDTDGRFHSKWLNMMYPRLYLARNLLREDGLLAISIDDHELQHLRNICDEIFGEENFIATIAVQVNPRGRHLDKFVAKTHESVLLFAKNINQENAMVGLVKEGRMLEEYSCKDSRGQYREIGLRNRNQAFNPQTRPTLYYPLYVNPTNGTVAIDRIDDFMVQIWPDAPDGIKTCWTWGKQKATTEAESLIARQMSDGEWRIYRKDYLAAADGTVAQTLPKSLWIEAEFNNDYGRRAMQTLFGEAIIDFPKPPALIKYLLKLGSRSEDIILDFFAGSGVTGQCVMELNKEEESNRHFILVQLPEPTGRADFITIADVAEERVRRVAAKLKEANIERLEFSDAIQDRGFRAFKLAASNVREWDVSLAHDPHALEAQLSFVIDHVRPNRTDMDIIYEVIIKSGYMLSETVAMEAIDGHTVYSVAGGGYLICLESALTLDLIRAIANRNPERVLFLDRSFVNNDQLKTNAAQTFKAKNIVFRTL